MNFYKNYKSFLMVKVYKNRGLFLYSLHRIRRRRISGFHNRGHSLNGMIARKHIKPIEKAVY